MNKLGRHVEMLQKRQVSFPARDKPGAVLNGHLFSPTAPTFGFLSPQEPVLLDLSNRS